MRCGPACRKPTKLLGLPVDNTEIDFGEADQPVANLGFGNADRLADQRLAEEDHVAAPTDLAIAADLAHGVIGIVPGLLNLIGIGSRRGPIAARGRHLAERLVRAIVVEIVAEAVEARLLFGRRGGRWTRGLRLERGMHALVTPILLRRAGLDALQTNAQLDPVHRKPGQTARAGARGKRGAVVAADRARQTQLVEGLVDHRLHRLDRLRNNTAFDQKAAVGVGDRQRIAALPVGSAEPALEVDAPKVIWLVHRQKRLGQRHRSPAPTARLAQPLAPQQIANRRGRRPKPFRIAPLQYRAQLLGAPERPLAPQRHDRRGDLLGHRHAMPVRRPRACLQPTRPLFSIASQQSVAGVAADAIALTQRRHRQLPPQTFGDEGRLFVHYTGFLPWHRQSLPLPSEKTCPASIRSIMSDIYPVQTGDPPPHPDPLRPQGRRGGYFGHLPGCEICACPSAKAGVNFSRAVCTTFHCRGTTSSVSVTSSPSLASLPPQHGQAAGAGITTRSRGRCSGKGARTGFLRVKLATTVASSPGLALAASSSSVALASSSSSCSSS